MGLIIQINSKQREGESLQQSSMNIFTSLTYEEAEIYIWKIIWLLWFQTTHGENEYVSCYILDLFPSAFKIIIINVILCLLSLSDSCIFISIIGFFVQLHCMKSVTQLGVGETYTCLRPMLLKSIAGKWRVLNVDKMESHINLPIIIFLKWH